MEMLSRSGRTPTFILAGLLIVILIISYNFWNSIQQNNELRQQIISLEEKYGDLTNKKSVVDKESEVCANRVKFFEERSETNQQAMKKKDDEMTELNKKLTDANTEIDNLKKVNDENANKIKTCDENKVEMEKVKGEKTSLTEEISRLTGQVTELNEKLKTSNCDEKVKLELTSAFTKLYNEITDANLRTKLKQVLNIDDKTFESLKLSTSQQQQPQVQETPSLSLQKRSDEAANNSNPVPSANNNEICSLPKNEGKCNSAIDKYYFDSTTKTCLTFKYTGCDGNANNFDTQQACENECLKTAQQQPSTTTTTTTTQPAVVDPNAAKSQENAAQGQQPQQEQVPLPNVDVPKKEEIVEVHEGKDNDEAAQVPENNPQDDSAKQPVEPHA